VKYGNEDHENSLKIREIKAGMRRRREREERIVRVM
jgi:hypothetical protein